MHPFDKSPLSSGYLLFHPDRDPVPSVRTPAPVAGLAVRTFGDRLARVVAFLGLAPWRTPAAPAARKPTGARKARRMAARGY